MNFIPSKLPTLNTRPTEFKVGDNTNKGVISFVDATLDFVQGNVKQRFENTDGTYSDIAVKTSEGWFRLSDLTKADPVVIDKNKIKPEITFEELMKSDIRICEVTSAERVKGTNNLLLLNINTGTDQRQVVTNIGSQYEPEELVNKRFPFALNLKPVRIRKIESYAMIIAVTEDDGKINIMECNSPVGSKLI